MTCVIRSAGSARLAVLSVARTGEIGTSRAAKRFRSGFRGPKIRHERDAEDHCRRSRDHRSRRAHRGVRRRSSSSGGANRACRAGRAGHLVHFGRGVQRGLGAPLSSAAASGATESGEGPLAASRRARQHRRQRRRPRPPPPRRRPSRPARNRPRSQRRPRSRRPSAAPSWHFIRHRRPRRYALPNLPRRQLLARRHRVAAGQLAQRAMAVGDGGVDSQVASRLRAVR